MKETYLEIYDVLLFRAEYIVQNRDDAHDIVQDLYVAISSHTDRYSTIKNKRGYLYGMVSKMSYMFLRNSLRHAEIEKTMLIGISDEGTDYCSEIDELLSQLTRLQKQVVGMHDIEGFSCFEIAIKIGRTPTSVKKQLALAHRKMKECTKNEY